MRKLLISFFLLLVVTKSFALTITTTTNEEAINTYNRSGASQTGPVFEPEPVVDPFVLQKKYDISLDAYINKVTAASGTITTPNREGTYYKAGIQADIRKANEKNEADYFQFGITHSKDPAVLSSAQNQINNLQFGRAREDYLFSGGDVAANFSSLGSSTAVRGLLAQKAFTASMLSLYTGIMADSWESLANSVPRSQFLREAYGMKYEHELNTKYNFYFTSQGGQDQADSVTDPNQVGTSDPKTLNNSTFGFDIKPIENLQVSGEVAQSYATQKNQAAEKGKAGILDASYAIGDFSFLFGYHDIDPNFNSLSTKATAGVQERSAGVDWKALSNLKLSFSNRHSLNQDNITSQKKEIESSTAGLSYTLNANWSISVQSSISKNDDLVSYFTSENSQNSAQVRYNASKWAAAISRSLETYRDPNSNAADSDTAKTRVNVGRSFSNGTESGDDATWLVDVKLEYALQNQEFVGGTKSENTSRSATVNAQFIEIGTVDLSLSDTTLTRPDRREDLKSFNREVAFSHDFANKGRARLYYRNGQTNSGDVALQVDEQTTGAQYSQTF